jgi:hypothetical protein
MRYDNSISLLLIESQFHLFDITAVPVLTFGCETRGNKHLEIVEHIHLNI